MKKYIKSFIFDIAQYLVEDGKGNSVLLQINYKDNSFNMQKTEKIDVDFVQEIEEVAKRLLEKKHGVNRVAFL